MKFILVMFIWTGVQVSPPSITAVKPFNSMTACQEAAKTIEVNLPKPARQFFYRSFTCVSGGSI